MNPIPSGSLIVDKGRQGTGINFRFVDPVIKTTNQVIYNLNEPIIISWEPYSGALSYSIQVYEKPSPHEYLGNNTVFSWSDRPQINETTIDLKTYTQSLKSGHYYSYEVMAMGDNGQPVSESARVNQSYDFEIK